MGFRFKFWLIEFQTGFSEPVASQWGCDPHLGDTKPGLNLGAAAPSFPSGMSAVVLAPHDVGRVAEKGVRQRH